MKKFTTQVLGNSIPGISIFIEQEPYEKPLISITTSKIGGFTFVKLKPGNYSLTFSYNKIQNKSEDSEDTEISYEPNSLPPEAGFDESTGAFQSYIVNSPKGAYRILIRTEETRMQINPVYEVTLNSNKSIQKIKLLKFTIISSFNLIGGFLKIDDKLFQRNNPNAIIPLIKNLQSGKLEPAPTSLNKFAIYTDRTYYINRRYDTDSDGTVVCDVDDDTTYNSQEFKKQTSKKGVKMKTHPKKNGNFNWTPNLDQS